MQYNIICIGKCKDKNIIILYEEFIKRLRPFAKVNILELAHAKGTVDEIKLKEANDILDKIPSSSFLIALDERGNQLKTSKFASLIKQKTLEGFSDFTLVIGGAEGLHQNVRDRANLVLGLSELTYPHMLVRVIITEQLYRITTYNNGHPYHREG